MSRSKVALVLVGGAIAVLCGVAPVKAATSGLAVPEGRNYRRDSSYGNQAYETHSEESYDAPHYVSYKQEEPILAAKDPDPDKAYINSRLTEAALTLGFLYFGYNILRPENIQNLLLAPAGPILPANVAAALGLPPQKGRGHDDYDENTMFNTLYEMVINSVDPVERGLQYLKVEDQSCKKRLVCESRQLVAQVPILERLTQQHGWILGSVQRYSDALDDGRTHQDCNKIYSDCPATLLSSFLY